MSRATVALLMLCGLASGCARLDPAPSVASAAKQADCRQRADEVYAKQNRAELYRSDTYATSQLDSPYSTSGLPGVTTRGLSGQYARDTMVSDCLDDTAGNVGSSAAQPAPVKAPTAP